MLSELCRFLEVLKSYFYGKSRYSKHLVNYTSEWTRDDEI